jgi:hypothetical protein
VLDISLPKLNGIEAARQIRRCTPQSRILFASENRSRDVIAAALGTGGLGYIAKSDAGTELLPAVDTVLQGKRYISVSMTRPFLVKSERESSKPVSGFESNPYLRYRESTLIAEFLESVMVATAADYGNVQLFDSENNVLRIVAQRGFDREFLRFFDTVRRDHGCVCSNAMNERSRIVVADVAIDPLFTDESRGVLLRAGVRSVQSTPLIDSSAGFVGMVSTHQRHAGTDNAQIWKRADEVTENFLAKIADPLEC